jgi:hypothetical protein
VTSEPTDLWEPFRYFLDSWTGSGTGKAGASAGERTYELTLADQFALVKSRSVFPPQESNPSGETHEDLGLISYATGAGTGTCSESSMWKGA